MSNHQSWERDPEPIEKRHPRRLERVVDYEANKRPATYPVDGVIVKLAFDPNRDFSEGDASETALIHAIFADRIARNLWLAIKWRHLTSQFFNEDCLTLAAKIRQFKPTKPWELAVLLILPARDPLFGMGSKVEMSVSLFPYLCGDMDIEYEVKEK